MPLVEIKDFIESTDNKPFFDQPVKNLYRFINTNKHKYSSTNKWFRKIGRI